MAKTIILTEQQVKFLLREMAADIEKINAEAEKADKHPTEAQKNASNYKMGHVTIRGFKISIENAKGSYRYWKDDKGNEGKTLMHNHYGYFSKTKGYDNDHIDVFIGKHLDFDKIFVVDQKNKEGNFDESKVMLGFRNKKEAKNAYLSNFSSDWKGFMAITEVDVDFFKKWLYDDLKQRKPFSKYVDVLNLNEGTDDTLQLHADFTDEEKAKQAKKEKKSQAAKKAAETRKKKKIEKQKAEDDAFWKQQDELGYKPLL